MSSNDDAANDDSNSDSLGDADPSKQQAKTVRDEISNFVKKIEKAKSENELYLSCEKYIHPQLTEEVKKHIGLRRRNVLYKIAQDCEDKHCPEAWVVSRLAQDHPELLDDGDGALYVAIQNKMVWFIGDAMPHQLGPTKDSTGQSVAKPNCITEAIIS